MDGTANANDFFAVRFESNSSSVEGIPACNQDTVAKVTELYVWQGSVQTLEPEEGGTALNCEGFRFDERSKCYPASKCWMYDPQCSYTFHPTHGDFGNFRCGHHNLFFSERKIHSADLPIGIAFRCDHPDSLHFGFAPYDENREWNRQTEGIWSGHGVLYNTECKSWGIDKEANE